MADNKIARPLEQALADMQTIKTNMSIIAQKLKTIEQNQEVIGRTIVAHNEKIRSLEESGTGSATATPASGAPEDLEKRVAELEKQVKETKYLLENINPLDYATTEQVKELINDRLKK